MAIHYNASIPTDGLSLYLDAANPKSWSQNTFPSALDIYTWYVTKRGDNTGNASTYSQDTLTSKSPANGIPMKMSVTGNDPHIGSYNAATWNIAPAVSGQTWILSVWVKASVNTTGEIYLFGTDASGVASNGAGGWWNITNKSITITTEWQRFDHFLTITNANVAYIQMRLDGPHTGGTGVDVWWDGLQMERAESSTALSDFNPRHNENGVNWINIINGTQSSLTGGCNFNTSNKGAITLDGTSGYVAFDKVYTVSNLGGTFSCWMYINDFNVQSGHTSGRITFGYTGFDFFNMLAVYNGGYGIESNTNSNPDELSGDNAPENAVPSIVAGTWINMTVVMQNLQHTFYTNAINRRTDVMPDNVLFNNFGEQANATSYPDFFKGKVGIIQIYNRALSAAEVSQNFNATRGRYGI